MTGPRRRDPGFADVFGANLARCREALGISQENLGLMADLHRTAVGQLERGQRIARADTALRLASCLGVEIGDLFRGLSWTPAEYTKGELIVQLEIIRQESRGEVN